MQICSMSSDLRSLKNTLQSWQFHDAQCVALRGVCCQHTVHLTLLWELTLDRRRHLLMASHCSPDAFVCLRFNLGALSATEGAAVTGSARCTGSSTTASLEGDGITPSIERSQAGSSLTRSATHNVVGSTTATSNRSFLVLCRTTEHTSSTSIRRFHTFIERADQSISGRWRINHGTPKMLSKLPPPLHFNEENLVVDRELVERIRQVDRSLWCLVGIPSVTTRSSGNSETTVPGGRPTKQLDRTKLFDSSESINTRSDLDAPFSNA